MKVQAKVQKWGNSLAIRIVGVMRDIPQFEEGTSLEVEVSSTGLKIQKLQKRFIHYTEAQLLKDLTPYKAHADILAHPIEGEF